MNKRISYHLTELKNELRKRAMKEKDEEKRSDYWRLSTTPVRVVGRGRIIATGELY